MIDLLIQIQLIENQFKEINKLIKNSKSKISEYLGMIKQKSRKIKTDSIEDSFGARKLSIMKECEELKMYIYELTGMIELTRESE